MSWDALKKIQFGLKIYIFYTDEKRICLKILFSPVNQLDQFVPECAYQLYEGFPRSVFLHSFSFVQYHLRAVTTIGWWKIQYKIKFRNPLIILFYCSWMACKSLSESTIEWTVPSSKDWINWLCNFSSFRWSSVTGSIWNEIDSKYKLL